MIASATQVAGGGLALGIAVVAVVLVIVITIVLLAQDRETGEDGPGAVEVVRADRRAWRHRADQRLGREDPARRPLAAEGGGRNDRRAVVERILALALALGAAAAVVAAILLVGPADGGRKHREVGRRPARDSRQGGREHREHPATRSDGACAGADRRRGRRPGRLHERAHGRIRLHERHGPAGASDRRARGSRGARAGRRADPRAQGLDADLRRLPQPSQERCRASSRSTSACSRAP